MLKKYKKLTALALTGVMAVSACTFSTSAAQSEAQPSSTEKSTSRSYTLHLSEGDIVEVTLNVQCDSIFGGVIANIYTEKDYLYASDELAQYVNKKDDEMDKIAELTDILFTNDTFKQGLYLASMMEEEDKLNVRGYNASPYDVYDCTEDTPFITATFKALSDCETTVIAEVSETSKTIIDENNVHHVLSAIDESSVSADITINGFGMGDVDNNGRVTVSDAIEVQKHIASITTLTGAQYTLADMNYDGRITVADAIEIQKDIAGIA